MLSVTIGYVGNTTMGLGLILLGASFDVKKFVAGINKTLVAVVTKIVISPIIAVATLYLFGYRGEELLIGLIYLSFDGNLGAIQFYCLLSFPLISLYNGKSGTKKLKYAFYIFYPLHIIVIEGVSILMKMLQ